MESDELRDELTQLHADFGERLGKVPTHQKGLRAGEFVNS